MADIQCSECGTLSATPRAHQLHICRPVEPIRVAPPVEVDSRTMKYRGMSPREGGEHNSRVGRARTRFGGQTRGRVNDRMAGIILCDRCGSISTERVAGSIAFLPNPQVEEIEAGLCPGCAEELYRWFKDPGQAPKALTAYREPFDPETVAEPVVDQAETTERAILDGD